MGKDHPIVVVKKPRRGGHAHHGGSWKVAYADFVTALMAFFLVLWIVGQSRAVRAAVGAYFRDPGVFEQQRAAGLFDGDSAAPAAPTTGAPSAQSADYKRTLEATAQRLREVLSRTAGLNVLREQIEIQIGRDGLRIELIDSSESTFFDTGSDVVKPATERILTVIAQELGSSHLPVVVEGHTDSAPYGTPTYTNWELSADRANAARRILQRSGVAMAQLRGVRGYADTVPRTPDRLDPRNRRVSVIVQVADVGG